MKLSLHALGAKSRRGLSLLEMMVSVTMLSIIMLGLLAMFQHTQKALHLANTQADIFENARGAIQMLSRDLSEMTASDVDGITNLLGKRIASPAGSLTLPGINVPLDMNEAFWLTRVNDAWQGVGYYVVDDPAVRTNYGVGTLYRFSANVRRDSIGDLAAEFTDPQPTNVHRVSDGIVHFSMAVTYVSGTNGQGQPIFSRADNFTFVSNDLPAFVDLELGVLEPSTLKQFQSIASLNTASAQNFLREHAGQIPFFRERVPVRNFLNPYRAHEVP